MRNSKAILIILIFISSISIYFHYLNFQSFKIQGIFLEDIRNNNFTDKDLGFIKKINYNYPTLNQTAIPIKAITGHYYLGIDSIQKGIDLLNAGVKDNPFLNYSEGILADYYYSVNELDSFNKYTRKIIKEIPNSPVHYVLFSKLLMMEEKVDSILITFESTMRNQKIKDYQTWKVFLAAMKEKYNQVDSVKVINYAREAKEIFPENEEIKILADYILFSEENIKQSQKIYDEAIITYNSNKELGIKKINEALDLYPNNELALKNIIKAYFYNEEWGKVISSYKKYTQYIVGIDFEPVFFYAASLMNLGEKSSSCGVFKYLVENNYTIPQDVKSQCLIQ